MELVFPTLPALCTACASTGAWNLVPDRGDDLLVRFQVLCPLCLDELLALFPLTPRMFARREITGRLRR